MEQTTVQVTNKTLTDYYFVKAAELLNIDVAAIKAVTEIESPKGGFLKNGKPTILFEAKYFHNLTNGKYDLMHPNVSSPKWDRSLYYGGEKEYDRLGLAITLDKDAALQSASWGRFQIMGANYKTCGYDTVSAFVDAMYESEYNHLIAFCKFIQNNKMDVYLRNKQWAEFARRYNGPKYKENNYDTKLEKAYTKYA